MGLSDLIAYWHVIRKRLWVIVSLLVTTATTIIGVSLTRPPLYRSSVRFQVTAIPPGDVTLYQAARGGQYREEIAATQANFIQIITSLEVAWQTVQALELPMEGRELADRLELEQSTGSDFVSVAVTAEDPQLAAHIANTLIAVALQRYGELNAYPLTLTREFITSQVEQARQELSEAQTEMIRFQIENKVGTLESSIAAQHSLIRSLELAHDEALAEGKLQLAANYEEIIIQRQLELQETIQLSNEYATLASRAHQLQSTYDFLLEKETEVRLKENEALNLGFIQVLGPARVPDEPERRISVSILALGIVISLATGLVITFGWEYLERTRPTGSSALVTERDVEFADA